MKLRVISLLLAIVLTVMLLPASASAAATAGTELETQIRNTYRTALRYAGRRNFKGYCGSLVNWQTYILGIDTHKLGCDGKDEFDLYRNMGTTSGGYTVKSYPASRYDLRGALNAITRNGTVDAYNLVVGFQRTNTQEGSIYGHALFIHGIIDGEVYFVESFSTSLDGKYWAEGTPIHCSIDAFCNAYNRWTVFDGIAYFGIKTYADACRTYPASMYALALSNTLTYSEPADPGLCEGTLNGSDVLAGEMVKVTALLETPGGIFYYQIDRGRGAEYVHAERLHRAADCTDDLTLTDHRMPTVVRKGNGYVLRGIVSAMNSDIRNITVSVYGGEPEADGPLMEGRLEVDGKSISLDTWQLDRYMTFRQLKEGTYRICVTAEVMTYVLKNGVPTASTGTVKVWDSAFRVVTDWKQYATITLDGNGGTADAVQTVFPMNSTLDDLPEAHRAGCKFAGWSLDPEGTQMVTRRTAVTGNVTLYAQWFETGEPLNGWYYVNGSWRYYVDGVSVSATTSAVDPDRDVVANWHVPGGALMAAGTALHVAGPCLAEAQAQDAMREATPTQSNE